jgi:glycolate oxidase
VRHAASPLIAEMAGSRVSMQFIEDGVVPVDRLADYVRLLRKTLATHALPAVIFGHAGDGNLHPTALCDERDGDEMHRVHAAFEEIFDAAVERGGTITGEHGIGLSKRPFFERHSTEGTLELTRRVRSAVDPNGVLNPGKILLPMPRRESLVV